MAYRFRLRWRLEHGRSLEGLHQPLTVNLVPGIGDCELRPVGDESHVGGQDLALESGTFDSVEAAEAAGEKALAGLLLASVRQGFGLMIRARIPGGMITNYGKNMLAGGRFDRVYDDSYGLTVFEDTGRTGFAELSEARFLSNDPAERFVDTWSSAVTNAARWDERILVSYDLYASSRFESSSRARFLLLIMAIEALVEQPDRSESELALITRLLETITEAHLPKEQSAALLSGVGKLKRVSISYACRTYLAWSIAAKAVTDPGAADHFTMCYQIRGRIIHGGDTPSASLLTDHSNRIEKTVRELLMASIEGRTERIRLRSGQTDPPASRG